MNIAQIENNLTGLVKDISKENFIYDLLLAYGVPKATVSLLKKGKRNLSKRDDQIILKKKLFFQEIENQDLHSAIDALKSDDATHRHDPRFIVVTDYKTLLAVDTKTADTLDISITDIIKHPFFFGPWAKIEKTAHANENPADVKAAEKMAKIYDEILQNNDFETKIDLHGLNIFLSRLLFCFFAEDTGIFEGENAFTNAISSHTQNDGSDLQEYLNKLFELLNTPMGKPSLHNIGGILDSLNDDPREKFPDYLNIFPYVNGGLFGDSYDAPIFSRKARKMIIECGELDWQDINPDIFGSMFQAVVHVDQRSNMGMHYTSVPNIMKVIEPLFLNELRCAFEKHRNNQSKLENLLIRLENLRIFDPACGSGNFLIIAYKEIRTLEMQIFERIQEIAANPSLPFSRISLSQFYGIELDDFAHEIAILSLWLAEHQMNVAFKAIFGDCNPTLPLKEGGNIVCANATRIPWEDVCPKDKKAEIYILGNPPYLGAKNQTSDQKEDMRYCLSNYTTAKNIDYISCWFIKASNFITPNNQFAFVTTNSICQGTQVPLLWPIILKFGLEIFFTYKEFKWSNNAKSKAGVTCSIIGIRHRSKAPKTIFFNNESKIADNISPYLIDATDTVVVKRSSSISKLPKMQNGNQPYDGGFLIFEEQEKNEFIKKAPLSKRFFKKLIGSSEFIKGTCRWCIWIEDDELKIAESIPSIKALIEKVRMSRLNGGECARSCADRPHQFRWVNRPKSLQIIVPLVSSERRDYIPVGFLNRDIIASNKVQVIFDPDTYVLGILMSRMHMTWVKTITGRIRSDYQYTAGLCYNSYPLTNLTDKQKQTITTHVYNVLEEREKHSEKTMAQLYDPDKMPDGLRQAHHDLDIAVERCYRSKPFTSDEERLEYLFKLYEQMTNKEKTGDLL